MHPRRLVTGIDEYGRSAVVMDGNSPGHFDLLTARFDVIWRVPSLPPGLLSTNDPAQVEVYSMRTPENSLRWVVLTVPPESESQTIDRKSEAFITARKRFDDGGVYEAGGDGWHTTNTLDLVLVVDGQIDLELDNGIHSLSAGDCVVQRGTRHRWMNRSDRPCVLSGVIIGAAADAKGAPGAPR